jgi:hypothetical protein
MDRTDQNLLEQVDARTKLAGSNKMEILLFSLGTHEIFRHQCLQGARSQPHADRHAARPTCRAASRA